MSADALVHVECSKCGTLGHFRSVEVKCPCCTNRPEHHEDCDGILSFTEVGSYDPGAQVAT